MNRICTKTLNKILKYYEQNYSIKKEIDGKQLLAKGLNFSVTNELYSVSLSSRIK